MHEMGIAMEIMKVAVDSIPAEMRRAKVKALNVRIGKLSGVVPESLRFCFDIMVQDTPFAGVKLNIEEVPIQARCRECGAVTIIKTAHFACLQCRGVKLEVISGQELFVTSLELAEPEVASSAS
jgi:hydrogenase nickel incorporation protein HypA/HybF